VPIPGKPPRQVVIDRQRKLFASLNIEDLLLELVSTIKFKLLFIFRESTIKIHNYIKPTGSLSNLLTTPSTTVDSPRSGLSMAATQSAARSALSEGKVYGKITKVKDIGAQF